MFDFVRKHNKIMQFLLFLLIVPSFVLVGINGYDQMRDKGDVVAKVDGHDITQREWDSAHKQEVDRIRQQMPNVDMKLLDSPAAKYATLERIVRERVIQAAASKLHLTASDARLARELQTNPLIAQLKGPDGKLDVARYRQLVSAQGMTPEMFEEGVRTDLSARQVMLGLGGSSFSTPAQASPSLGAFFEKREIQVARFDAKEFASRVSPSEADIEAYYKEHPAMFQAPEQASIEYLVLDLESVKKSLAVSEAELKSYYEQNIALYSQPEQRRASHILIMSAKNAPAAEREKAKARAQEVAAQAKKSPETFADLARKNSQDEGSAKAGGDLDWQTRGAFVKPVEDAMFSMKKGAISDVVESEFGFHVIRLVDVRDARKKSFEEVRPEIEAKRRTELAQQKFAEAADTFSNGVYEQADSLKPVADKLKLEVRTATGVKRTPGPGDKGPLANAKLLAALFAPDSVEKKRNTEAVETAPSTLVSARVTQYSPARTLPLSEVKDRVRERVVAAKAAELAKKEGAARLAEWKSKPDAAPLPAAVTVSRQEGPQLPQAVVEAALRNLPGSLSGVDLGEQGYAIVKVNRIVARTAPTPDIAKQEQSQYENWWATAEMLAYYDLLKERFKAQIKVPKPAPEPAAAPAQRG